MTLQAPLLHMNGSGYENLSRSYMAQYNAIDAAIDALRHGYPHGRDYYPLGDHALPKAQKEAQSRLQRLDAIKGEIEEIILAIKAQEKRT